MSNLRTGLKIFSVVIILLGLYDFVGGLILVFAQNAPDLASTILDIRGLPHTTSTGILVFGVMFLIAGLINIIIGGLGWRGAKNPAKVGAFVWIALIGVILSLINLVSEIAQGTFTFSSAFDAFFLIVIFITAYRIRKNYRENNFA